MKGPRERRGIVTSATGGGHFPGATGTGTSGTASSSSRRGVLTEWRGSVNSIFSRPLNLRSPILDKENRTATDQKNPQQAPNSGAAPGTARVQPGSVPVAQPNGARPFNSRHQTINTATASTTTRRNEAATNSPPQPTSSKMLRSIYDAIDLGAGGGGSASSASFVQAAAAGAPSAAKFIPRPAHGSEGSCHSKQQLHVGQAVDAIRGHPPVVLGPGRSGGAAHPAAAQAAHEALQAAVQRAAIHHAVAAQHVLAAHQASTAQMYNDAAAAAAASQHHEAHVAHAAYLRRQATATAAAQQHLSRTSKPMQASSTSAWRPVYYDYPPAYPSALHNTNNPAISIASPHELVEHPESCTTTTTSSGCSTSAVSSSSASPVEDFAHLSSLSREVRSSADALVAPPPPASAPPGLSATINVLTTRTKNKIRPPPGLSPTRGEQRNGSVWAPLEPTAEGPGENAAARNGDHDSCGAVLSRTASSKGSEDHDVCKDTLQEAKAATLSHCDLGFLGNEYDYNYWRPAPPAEHLPIHRPVSYGSPLAMHEKYSASPWRTLNANPTFKSSSASSAHTKNAGPRGMETAKFPACPTSNDSCTAGSLSFGRAGGGRAMSGSGTSEAFAAEEIQNNRIGRGDRAGDGGSAGGSRNDCKYSEVLLQDDLGSYKNEEELLKSLPFGYASIFPSCVEEMRAQYRALKEA